MLVYWNSQTFEIPGSGSPKLAVVQAALPVKVRLLNQPELPKTTVLVPVKVQVPPSPAHCVNPIPVNGPTCPVVGLRWQDLVMPGLGSPKLAALQTILPVIVRVL